MKKALFFLSFLLSSFTVLACDCAPLQKLSKEQSDKYNLIFTGRVDSVSACIGDKSTVYFTIHQLFKGESTRNITVNIDCVSSCRVRMQAGENWLIYAAYEKYGDLRVGFCGRSRKYAANINEDESLARTGMSYDEELKFIVNNYGVQQLESKEKEVIQPLERELVKPQGMQIVWLLAGSLAGMLIIWFLLKKFTK